MSLVACGVFVSAVRAAAQSSVEDRLLVLEDQIRALQKENSQLRRDLGVAGTAGLVSVRPAGKEPVLALNGLVQTQAEFGDKGDSRGSAHDRFRVRRVRLGASGRFLEEFDFKVEGEYVGSGVTMTDGFLNWNKFAWANVKVGQFKTPYGYEFLASDPKLFTIERTLGSDRLTLNRQVGVQAAGALLEKKLTYAAGVFNGSGANKTSNDNNAFLYVARVAGTPWQGRLFGESATWTLGVNGFTSEDTALSMPSDFGFTGAAFSGRREGFGLDTQLNLGRFDFWAELLGVTFRPDDNKPADSFGAKAWYVQATYFVISKRLQTVLKYDEFDPDDRKAANDTSSWTLGANWFIKGDDLKLQLDYVRTDVASLDDIQNQLWLRAQVIF